MGDLFNTPSLWVSSISCRVNAIHYPGGLFVSADLESFQSLRIEMICVTSRGWWGLGWLVFLFHLPRAVAD